jgi:hypothetical protein
MVGELTSSLLSEAFAPIARTCESYCTSIAARLSFVTFEWRLEGIQSQRLIKVRSVWGE